MPGPTKIRHTTAEDRCVRSLGRAFFPMHGTGSGWAGAAGLRRYFGTVCRTTHEEHVGRTAGSGHSLEPAHTWALVLDSPALVRAGARCHAG